MQKFENFQVTVFTRLEDGNFSSRFRAQIGGPVDLAYLGGSQVGEVYKE